MIRNTLFHKFMGVGKSHSKAIKVKMLLFGPLAEKMGTKAIEVAIDEGYSSVDLAERFGISEMLSNGLRIAVDGNLEHDPKKPLCDGAEVAFLPPVSGG